MKPLLLAVSLLIMTLPASAPAAEAPRPPKPPAGVKAIYNLEYIQGGHERNKLDLYLPEKPKGPMPLIVCVHGGGWGAGSKENVPAFPMLLDGYAVASINYRLLQHAPFPAQIQDCKAAIRWLRAHAKQYRLDPDHVAVWGHSAGGHLVALLGTTAGVKAFEGNGGHLDQSSRVQAVVDWAGPADLWSLYGHISDPKAGPSVLLGGAVHGNKAKALAASPITYVSKDAAPFFIVHGDKDDLVPISQSQRLAEALKKAGAEVTLRTLVGIRHGSPEFFGGEARRLTEEFLRRHLRPGR